MPSYRQERCRSADVSKGVVTSYIAAVLLTSACPPLSQAFADLVKKYGQGSGAADGGMFRALIRALSV